MPDPVVNAVPEPQIQEASPVLDSKPNSDNLPSPDPKPELIDFAPLGDSFKELKLSKDIAEKLPDFLKDITKEDFDMLSDKQLAKLFFTSEKGYRASHSERFRAEQEKIQAAETKLKTIADREKVIVERENELAEIEGDAYFYRDEKVKKIAREAAKEAEELGLDGERAETYVNKITKPYLDQAKQQHKDRKTQVEAQLKTLMDGNSKIGRETFPEIDPTLAAHIVDGFAVNGSDPQSAAQLFRKELDRVIEYERVKAVADYIKKLNEKQPNAPAPITTKPIPSSSLPSDIAKEVEKGRALFGMFGK